MNVQKMMVMVVGVVVMSMAAAGAYAQGQEAGPAKTAGTVEKAAPTIEDLPTGGRTGGTETVIPGLEMWAVLQMLFWLAVLLGALYGTMRVVRRYVPAARGLFAGGQVLKVIARTHLSPKQSILLVKVGERMLVVGVTPSSMNTLSEIREAGELAGITRELTQKAGADQEFQKTLKEASRELETQGAGAGTEEEEKTVRELRTEIDAIAKKVSLWRRGASD